MQHVYHIVDRSTWEGAPAGPYRADSLATEGFIHCSNRDQVARVANRFYRDRVDLVVLRIDVSKLTAPLRDEDAGTGELFPHVYGPIDRAALVAVEPLTRDGAGNWTFPP